MLQTFLTSAVGGNERSTSPHDLLTLRGKSAVPLNRKLGGPQNWSEHFERRKSSCLCWESKPFPRSSSLQSSEYTALSLLPIKPTSEISLTPTYSIPANMSVYVLIDRYAVTIKTKQKSLTFRIDLTQTFRLLIPGPNII